MSNLKCSGCGLYNFTGVTQCRRCKQPIEHQLLSQPISDTQTSSVDATAAYYMATSIPAKSAFSAQEPWSSTNSYMNDDSEDDTAPNHRPALILTFFCLSIMLVCAGIPPQLQNVSLSFVVFHIIIAFVTLCGLGKWVFTRNKIEKNSRYSGEIEGFLNLPAAGMIVYGLVKLWVAIECWSVGSKLETHFVKDLLKSLASYSFLSAILFLIALIFFYRKSKRAPTICITVVLLQVLMAFLSSNSSVEIESGQPFSFFGGSSPNFLDAYIALFLSMCGGISVLFNFGAFVLYFILSRRVKATFV